MSCAPCLWNMRALDIRVVIPSIVSPSTSRDNLLLICFKFCLFFFLLFFLTPKMAFLALSDFCPFTQFAEMAFAWYIKVC